MSEIDAFFSLLCVEFYTYDWNQHTFVTNKTQKTNKTKKIRQFSCKPGKLASNLKMNITKMGKTVKSETYDNFFFFIQILAKIIINFSDLSVSPIFVIVIFNLDC